MPLYEYECPVCATTFTLIRDLEARFDPASCESCDAPGARRVLSAFSVRAGAVTRPQSLAQQLAGPGVVAGSSSQPSSVLGGRGCAH